MSKKKLRLYLDCCCYNRPFDDLSDTRIQIENNAIIFFMNLALSNDCVILGSEILNIEIEEIKNLTKKFKVRKLYEIASEYIQCTSEIEKFAEEICDRTSIRFMDSLHIASAEFGKADLFLTTDDKLIRMCKNISLRTRVVNPAIFFKELIENVKV